MSSFLKYECSFAKVPRLLIRQRPLSCSWLSAGDGGEVDAEGVEFGDAGLGVTEPGGSVAALVIVEVPRAYLKLV